MAFLADDLAAGFLADIVHDDEIMGEQMIKRINAVNRKEKNSSWTGGMGGLAVQTCDCENRWWGFEEELVD